MPWGWKWTIYLIVTDSYLYKGVTFYTYLLRRPWVWKQARTGFLLAKFFFAKSRRCRQKNGFKPKFNMYIWWKTQEIADIFGETMLVHQNQVSRTRSSSRYAALLLVPAGGTLASRAGGPSAPISGLRPLKMTPLYVHGHPKWPPTVWSCLDWSCLILFRVH